MMPATGTPSQLQAVVRRGALAGLLLPGLLLVNLLCLCAHRASASDAPIEARGHCEAHAAGGVPQADEAPGPQGHDEGGHACLHCGDGSGLFASPRAASAVPTLPLPLGPALLHPVALDVADAAGLGLRASSSEHTPPPPRLARNHILRI